MNLACKMVLGDKRAKAFEGAQHRMFAWRQSQKRPEGNGLASGAWGDGGSHFIFSFIPPLSEMKNPLCIHSHPLLVFYLGLGSQSGATGLSLTASTQGLKASPLSSPGLMESNHFLICHRKDCPPVTLRCLASWGWCGNHCLTRLNALLSVMLRQYFSFAAKMNHNKLVAFSIIYCCIIIFMLAK